MTHLGKLPRFLACNSLMMWAFSTTGFPGATFSPSRYRTVVENFDWVFMTWGGCLSTTRELKGNNTVTQFFFLVPGKEAWKNVVLRISRTIPLNQNLQKVTQPFLEIRNQLPYQHQLLPEFSVHSEQLLAPDGERDMQRQQESEQKHKETCVRPMEHKLDLAKYISRIQLKAWMLRETLRATISHCCSTAISWLDFNCICCLPVDQTLCILSEELIWLSPVLHMRVLWSRCLFC